MAELYQNSIPIIPLAEDSAYMCSTATINEDRQ